VEEEYADAYPQAVVDVPEWRGEGETAMSSG